jgi:hemoglobin
MKKDIEDRHDIQLLIDSFYKKVKVDEVIGFIFTDIAKVNWEKHLPVMYNFWESILFYTGGYAGNPMELHRRLNQLIPLSPEHFKRWTDLFTSTADELFTGEKTELAKQRAISIATMMRVKILQHPGDISKA